MILSNDWQYELRQLKPGWNSYGGAAISEAAISTLGGFAVVPCSGGGIQLEVSRDGWDIEIGIGADGRITFCLMSNEFRATP